MTNPCGVNFDITRIHRKDTFHERMQVLNPALLVPRIENFNDAPLIEELAARYSNARIHARVMESKEEGSYHLRPEAPGDNRPMVATPEDLIDKYGRLGKRNMSLYLLNETGDKNTARNPDAIDRLNKWVVRACKHASATKTNITILNWGVQMPYPDGRFDEALEAMSEYRQWVTLAVHEYLPRRDVDGNLRVLYFINILKRYKDVLKKPAPLITNTEFGYDGADGSDKSNFESRGISDEQAARDFIDVFEVDYREYIDSGELEGAAFFSYTQWGDKDGEGFGLEGRPGFWDVLLKWKYERRPAPPKEPTKPIPQFVPKPDNARIPIRIIADSGRNLRSGPDTNYSDSVASDPDISVGDELTYYSVPAVKDNATPPRYWHWAEVHSGASAGKAGWVCLTGFKFRAPVPPVEPEPEVPADTPRKWLLQIEVVANDEQSVQLVSAFTNLFRSLNLLTPVWGETNPSVSLIDLSPQEVQ